MDEHLKRIEVELTMNMVDPELLKILYGSDAKALRQGMEIRTPIRRTFWQWLIRRPVQWRTTYFPNVEFTRVDETTWSGEVKGQGYDPGTE